MQIRDSLQWANQQLADNSDSPRLDAELLLAHVLDKTRSYLFTWPEKTMTKQQQQAFSELIKQRRAGQPVAYLLGYREFWGLCLEVTHDTLIPRPDTELLVETALKLLASTPTPTILDLGTGSGAIAIALASERPDATIIATDLSPAALQVARENAHTHNITTITFIESNWLEAIARQPPFNLIISNPPYIAEGDTHLTEGDVRFEPTNALISGPDGLDDIRHLTEKARHYLTNTGFLVLEHGYDQGDTIKNLMQQTAYRQVTCLHDLSGHPRCTYGQR